MFKPNTFFLIVDDFQTSRKIVKNALADMGFQNSIEAADGAEAYQILIEKSKTDTPIEFIISDWNMPNMLGIDLLKKVRSEKEFKDLPFMLITVESEPTQILEAGEAGVTEYIIKPFTNDVLKEKLGDAYKKINQSVL